LELIQEWLLLELVEFFEVAIAQSMVLALVAPLVLVEWLLASLD
jgi:hypothetical protein